MLAVVSDGTAVLGLGDIGPAAAQPVMEGKCLIFKAFAGIDAVPICLATTDPDEIVETVQRIAPVFGGINLEDIAAPKCFLIEDRLRTSLDIPVMHDDQHGTAIVVLAALTNALRLIQKLSSARIVILGAGAAGVANASAVQEVRRRAAAGLLAADLASCSQRKNEGPQLLDHFRVQGHGPAWGGWIGERRTIVREGRPSTGQR